MKRIATTIVIIFITSILAAPAFASPKLKTLEVQVWPEYDKPSVLIMYAGEVQEAKNITIYFPKGTQVNKVLKKITSDQGFENKYKTKNTKDHLAVSFNLPYPTFFTEGYWDILSNKGADKKFEFDLTVPIDAKEIQLYIQKPLGASNFKVIPEPAGFSKDPKTNIESARFLFNNKKAGEVIKFSVGYRKADSTLSIQRSQDSANKGGTADTKTVWLVILALVFFTVGGFALYAFKQNGVKVKGRPASRKGRKEQKTKSKTFKINYCPNCGAQARGKFCSQCGQKLD